MEQPPAITKPATTPTEAHKSRVPSHPEPGKFKQQQQKQQTPTKLENLANDVTKVEIIQEVAKIKDDTIIEEPAKLEEELQDNKVEKIISSASDTLVTVAEEKKDKVTENKQPEAPETKNEEDLEEVCDMTGNIFFI